MRRGLSSEAAVATVQDVLGDLALPPSNGAARTVLGTYDGTGNLFSWLSIVLVRRIAGDARKKKPASLDADPDGGGHPERTPSGRTVPEPAGLAADDEARRRFAAALERAWQGLSSQERLALVAKHRDGWSQRQVGALLGLGEARVSRIVSAAVEESLRGPLRDGRRRRRCRGRPRGRDRDVLGKDGAARASFRWRAPLGSRRRRWAGAEPPAVRASGMHARTIDSTGRRGARLPTPPVARTTTSSRGTRTAG